MHLPNIWIERIPLLQVYLSHFIQGTQLWSACSSSGLIYYGSENWSFRREMPCANYFIIVIYYEDFLYFVPTQFFVVFFVVVFFCVLAYENKEAFSERCSLVSGVVQCLVKTCEKYTEVNHFVLLSCSLYINFGRMFFYLSGGNYFQGKFYGEGKIF